MLIIQSRRGRTRVGDHCCSQSSSDTETYMVVFFLIDGRGIGVYWGYRDADESLKVHLHGLSDKTASLKITF